MAITRRNTDGRDPKLERAIDEMDALAQVGTMDAEVLPVVVSAGMSIAAQLDTLCHEAMRIGQTEAAAAYARSASAVMRAFGSASAAVPKMVRDKIELVQRAETYRKVNSQGGKMGQEDDASKLIRESVQRALQRQKEQKA